MLEYFSDTLFRLNSAQLFVHLKRAPLHFLGKLNATYLIEQSMGLLSVFLRFITDHAADREGRFSRK